MGRRHSIPHWQASKGSWPMHEPQHQQGRMEAWWGPSCTRSFSPTALRCNHLRASLRRACTARCTCERRCLADGRCARLYTTGCEYCTKMCVRLKSPNAQPLPRIRNGERCRRHVRRTRLRGRADLDRGGRRAGSRSNHARRKWRETAGCRTPREESMTVLRCTESAPPPSSCAHAAHPAPPTQPVGHVPAHVQGERCTTRRHTYR